MSDIHSPPNTMPHIGKVWAYLSKDEHGNEGVCAVFSGAFGTSLIPLIAADQVRLAALTPIAGKTPHSRATQNSIGAASVWPGVRSRHQAQAK